MSQSPGRILMQLRCAKFVRETMLSNDYVTDRLTFLCDFTFCAPWWIRHLKLIRCLCCWSFKLCPVLITADGAGSALNPMTSQSA